MRRTRFTLLTRPDCHLCEALETELLQSFGEALEVELAHVDAHPQWLAQYGLHIPVLLDAQEQFVCAVQLDHAAVQAALAH